MTRSRVGELVHAQPGQTLPAGGEQRYMTMLNAEGAMAIGAIICAQPGVVFNGGRLFNEFIDRQGEDPAWRAAGSGPIRTAIQSLVPTGGVVQTSEANKGKYSKATGLACQAVENQAAELLAVSGAGIRWSLLNPDISVQQMLGRPRYSTATDGVTQYLAPWIRYRACEYLATTNKGTALQELHASLLSEFPGYRLLNLDDLLAQMARQGVLDKTGVRTFRLHPERRRAISSLLKSIDSLHTPTGFKRNLNYALRVITRADDMNQLLAKAIGFSNGRRSADVRDGRMPSLEDRILFAMRDLPAITTLGEIRESLEADDTHRYSNQNLQGALQTLFDDGFVAIRGQLGPGAANQYTLLPKPKRRSGR